MRKPRLRLQSLMFVVATLAVGLFIVRSLSPTRRWTRQLAPDHSRFERMEAAQRLGFAIPDLERDQAFAALILAEEDPDPLVRAAACYSISLYGEHAQEAASRLIALATGDRSSKVRLAACEAMMGMIGRKSIPVRDLEPTLRTALDDEDPEVRLKAAQALYAGARGRLAVPALSRVFREEDGIRQAAALGLLLRLGIPPELEPEICRMLRSQEPSHVLIASQALIGLGKREIARSALSDLKESRFPAIRDQAQQLIDQMDPRRGEARDE